MMPATKVAATLLLAALAVPAFAAAPEKRKNQEYEELWTDSMFTTPPVVVPGDPPANPLDDFTLAGLSRVADGWYVILISKTNREERVRLRPNETNTFGFRVVSVVNATSRTEAAVEIQAGTQTGTVQFDAQFLQVRAAAPKAPAAQRPGAAPAPNQPPIPVNSSSRPRNVRRIPTPPGR